VTKLLWFLVVWKYHQSSMVGWDLAEWRICYLYSVSWSRSSGAHVADGKPIIFDRSCRLYNQILSRASAEKFPGGGNGKNKICCPLSV